MDEDNGPTFVGTEYIVEYLLDEGYSVPIRFDQFGAYSTHKDPIAAMAALKTARESGYASPSRVKIREVSAKWLDW